MSRQTFAELCSAFPSEKHSVMRPQQRQVLEFWAQHPKSIIEMPTGHGKTAVEYAILKAAANAGKKPLFLITPNKTILQQIYREYLDLAIVVGKHDFPCYYYEDNADERFSLETKPEDVQYRADEIACSFLRNCPHRVNLKTGETHEKDAERCQYYHFTHKAMNAPIVLCTFAYYLFSQLFTKRWEKPKVLVIDEAHLMGDVVRRTLSYEISDYHLGRAVKLLERLEVDETDLLAKFQKRMIDIVKKKAAWKPTIIEDGEILELMGLLEAINPARLGDKLIKAIGEGAVDEVEEALTLRQVEVLVRDIRRYIHSFEYSLDTLKRKRMNYSYAFHQQELAEGKRVQHKLVIKAHTVAPIIRSILGEEYAAFSATVGDKDTFGWETGMEEGEFLSLPSSFPPQNAKIFMPSDTPDLSTKNRKPDDLKKALKSMVKACKEWADMGIRSLVIVVSNDERDQFLVHSTNLGLDTVSYGGERMARTAAQEFKDGLGMTLVGTETNFGQGLDLPDGLAPVIFDLRPGYSRPDDPASVFEVRKWGESTHFKLEQWRVGIKSLQHMGRNIRSPKDKGAIIFISQQFRKIVWPRLSEGLRQYYDGGKSFAEAVAEVKRMFGK